MTGLFDPGAQNERTRLAWQRTLLSLVVCGLVVARLLATRALLAGMAVALVTVTLGVLLGLQTRRRYLAADSALRTSATLPDGRDALVLVLLLVTIGVGAMVMLLTWG
ncbi:DUF202 domain-containing protein [Auraticoccus sp. F435]|uniref:DUF202 domain-containing protein n=1 Tax=Auraticoccus cholistanensis TaxID=2656650 RepID=A0A6A9V0E0_9ACTN|nr:DUF202 domain-containing protein [Auraticoccus cholistanensis]